MKIQWLWNGIKVDGKLYPVSYSKGVLIGDTEESITLYARGYSLGLPKIDGLTVKNDSDGMTDYFETDRARIRQDSQFWNDALNAYLKHETHHKKMWNKRMDKINQKVA